MNHRTKSRALTLALVLFIAITTAPTPAPATPVRPVDVARPAAPENAAYGETTRVISPYVFAAWCGKVIGRLAISPQRDGNISVGWSSDSYAYLTPSDCESDLLINYPGAAVMVVDVQSSSYYGWVTMPWCHTETVGHGITIWDSDRCSALSFGAAKCVRLIVQVAWDHSDGQGFHYLIVVVSVCLA